MWGTPKVADSQVLLGFDFGMKRIGVAVGQSLTKTATALTVLSARDGIPNWDEIAELIQGWQADALVVGIPYLLDGNEQAMTKAARKFAYRLQARFRLPVYEAEERFTSIDARDQLLAEKKLKSGGAVDHYAAQLILETWFSEKIKGK